MHKMSDHTRAGNSLSIYRAGDAGRDTKRASCSVTAVADFIMCILSPYLKGAVEWGGGAGVRVPRAPS